MRRPEVGNGLDIQGIASNPVFQKQCEEESDIGGRVETLKNLSNMISSLDLF